MTLRITDQLTLDGIAQLIKQKTENKAALHPEPKKARPPQLMATMANRLFQYMPRFLGPDMEDMSMPQTNPTPSDRCTWPRGQRVSRKSTDELGTVVKTNGSIKVKWDSGQTSYFRHGEPGNVRLRELPKD
jgi:hypothetical protein